MDAKIDLAAGFKVTFPLFTQSALIFFSRSFEESVLQDFTTEDTTVMTAPQMS